MDVFTSVPLAGNPLAVVMNTCGLTTEKMQAIAREFNLSETTFVERRPAAVEQAEGVRVRIFATQEELNFAGHPTLGTAALLKLQAPEAVHEETVTLALNTGRVPVRFESVSGSREALFGEMTQREPEFGQELDRAEVARLTGLALDDLDPALPPRIVSTGTAFGIVALRSAGALAKLSVSQQEASAWLRERGARWFYVLAPTASGGAGNEPAWRARMQFYGAEDPATGSAAGCAIAYLVQRGAAKSGERIHLRQGVEVGRPSDLYLTAQLESSSAPAKRGCEIAKSARVTSVRVAGGTVLVAKGQFFLP
jgi:trans-2,3-dihydro-3-hydroxyanthranilate isomerase